MQPSDYIFGLRPVIEALEAGRELDKILVATDLRGDLPTQLLTLARQQHVLVKRVPQERLSRITRKNHQGVVAMLSAVTYHRLDHLVADLYERGVLPFVVVLDGVTDVRNFGAIARTCECAGVDALVIPQHGSVSVGGDAVKTSAGALMHLPVCRERSAYGAVKYLKDSGYKIVAVSEKAAVPYTECGLYTEPVALVMGAEDEGISDDILGLADMSVAIPMFGKIGSLNVAVAAGIVIYRAVDARLQANLQVM